MTSQGDDEPERLISAGFAAVFGEMDDSNTHRPRTHAEDLEVREEEIRFLRIRSAVWGALVVIFVFGLAFVFSFQGKMADWAWSGTLPRNPALAAYRVLGLAPVIDGHIDLPALVRKQYANNVSAVDLEGRMPGHVDIPRLRRGQIGGFFWSTFTPCEDVNATGVDFTAATWQVRDSLEQIDVARLLIAKYPATFSLALSAEDILSAIIQGKIASLLGVEGAHQLGNSIAVLRQYYNLGARYVTLTHFCHNAFADSCGFEHPIEPLHRGLSPLGHSLIDEMNRLGMLVDLSHTSDATAFQALNYSKAPVIWSHSSARAVHNVPRNVPDKVLELIGVGEGQKDAVVMVNFFPTFVAPPGKADVSAVADHIEHIAKVAGKSHVGVGSDFDGMHGLRPPQGLEDVSKYPALIAELYSRGWDKFELAGLAGGNFLRVFAGAELVARQLQASGVTPVVELYDKRPDLPKKQSLSMLEL